MSIFWIILLSWIDGTFSSVFRKSWVDFLASASGVLLGLEMCAMCQGWNYFSNVFHSCCSVKHKSNAAYEHVTCSGHPTVTATMAQSQVSLDTSGCAHSHWHWGTQPQGPCKSLTIGLPCGTAFATPVGTPKNALPCQSLDFWWGNT